MQRTVIAVLAGVAVFATLILAGRPLLVRWEADRTAHRFVQVLHTRDSVAFASLSGKGSPRTLRCIQQLWPEEFWSLNGKLPMLTKIPALAGEFGYRMLGDSLSGIGETAILEFFIVQGRPKKVDRIFVNSRLGVWTPAAYACLELKAA